MVARDQDQLRPKYVLSQGPRLAQTPTCFSASSLERTDELRCNALPLPLPLRSTQGTWAQGSNVWQAKGPNVRFSPGLAKEDAECRAGLSGTVAVLGAGGSLCACAVLASIASQASRRTCRRVEAEVRASRGARDDYGSADARILRGRLRRPGPALQWSRSQCKKRRSLCDRHRVRALERAKARAGGQGWAGLSGGRWVGGGGKCRSRSCSWRSQLFTPFAVGVGVAIAIARHVDLAGPQYTRDWDCLDWTGLDRHRHTSTGTSTGTGTGLAGRAQDPGCLGRDEVV